MQSVMTLYWKERRSRVPRSILRMQMDNKLMLPTGIEDFKEIRTDGYYYVDKTALIEQVLDKRSKVTLFTRPRRFGKTLNMSMLRYFFEIGTDSKLFNYFPLFIIIKFFICFINKSLHFSLKYFFIKFFSMFSYFIFIKFHILKS